MEVETKVNRLESIVERIGEAAIAATETVERLSDRVDALAINVQQQGYQIFALSDAIQALAENQDASLKEIKQLTQTLQRLVTLLEEGEEPRKKSAE